MFRTHHVAAVAVLTVVCVRIMTCVCMPPRGHDLCDECNVDTSTGTPPGYAFRSNEMWRFDTSKRRWEIVHNGTANGVVPTGNGRSNHVMTSVGLDLWMHGGLTAVPFGEDDTCSSPETLLLLLR
jgi:hypothetical protein